MSAHRWRWSFIALWFIVACLAFVLVGSLTVRSVSVLVAMGVIPPVMLLFLWNDDGPMVTGPGGGYR